MPKEVLFKLITEKHYLYILIIIGVYFLNWTVLLKLGLIINKSAIKTKTLLFPWAFLGVIYSLFAKFIIPDYLYYFASLFFLFLLLKNIDKKIKTPKVFFAALLSLLTCTFSIFLFGQPLLINDKLRTLLLGPRGIIYGILIETVLPILFVIIYRSSKSKQKTNNNFHNMAINISLLFVVYCLFGAIFYILAYYYNSILWKVLISEVILIGITFFVFFRFRAAIKKEQQRSEENHSTYLLRTILSKQREYRNFFQVIRAMAERESNQNIVDYIDHILIDMSLIEESNGVNPIFAAFQVAEQIKAKEKGVEISTKTKSDLHQLREPVQVYDIFKDLLQFFVDYEERVLADEHRINVEIDETDQEYIFKITRKNGREESGTDLNHVSTPPEGEHRLEQIAKRIRKLRGKIFFLYQEDKLRGCLFRTAKAKPKDYLFPFNFGT